MSTIEYLFFMLLFPVAFLPMIAQTAVLFVLAVCLLMRQRPKLDRFFVLMAAWCLIYFLSILINSARFSHLRADILNACFTLGITIAALLFYIHYRNINLNLTRVGHYSFWNLLIMTALALIYFLFPSSRSWTLFGKSMAVIDIISNDVYGYRFCGFLGSTNLVTFFIFFNFPLSIYYIEKRFRKRFQVVYALLIFIPVLATGSRIGLLLYSFLFLFFLYVELREALAAFYHRHRAASVVLFTAAGIAVALFVIWLTRMLFLLRLDSNWGRKSIYLASVKKVLSESFLIGLGINEQVSPGSADYMGAHSTYINVLYRTGILGLAIYAAALVFRLYDLFKDKIINKQRIVYIAAILETFALMTVEDVDASPWTICYFYIMVAIFDRISQPIETLAIKPSLNIAMLGQKHVRYREGGVEVVVAELSTRMVKLGHHVTCYDRGGHHISGKDFDSKRKGVYNGVVVKQVFTINKKGLAAFSSAFSAAIAASFSNADVIHFHAEGPCVMMWLPKLFGKCCVCTIHGIDWQRAKWKGIARKVIRYGEKVAAKHADSIIVLSRTAQEYFWETYHRKTILIPNGISIQEPVEVQEIRKLYGLEKEKYILFLGRIVPEKGIHYLIQAFRAVDTDFKLVIAGGASDTATYFEEVKELAEGDDRILFPGFVSGRPMQELYSNAYLYVLPSDLEGMPLTILEAMSYARCCLVSDIPECADVIGDAGVTFHHGDVEDLKRQLKNLLSDPALARDLGERAKKRALEGYSWDEITRRTLQVYRGTLDQVSDKRELQDEDPDGQ